MSTPLVTPNLLAQMRVGQAAMPALPAAPVMPSALSLPVPAVPLVSKIPTPPTQLQRDQNTLDYLKDSGSGVDQIQNPLLRGIARAGDIAASVFAPGIARSIPGTSLHHQFLVKQQEGNLANDQANQKAVDASAESQANTSALNAEVPLREAQTEAAQLANTGTQVAAARAANEGTIVRDGYGRPIAWQDAKGNTHAVGDPAIPAGIASVMSADPGKPATSEFELWHQQNPKGTAADFQQLQSKPLSQAEADSLNGVWNPLATKHHLPVGQFQAGMPHADATTLASALNSAIGKQQGDTHVSIDMSGLALRQQQQAAVNPADPAMQASINAVASGAMKLGDVFGRGATTAQKASFVAAVKAVNPAYNSGDFDVEKKVREDFTSGTDSNSLTAINRAREHMGVFLQSAKDLDNGNVQSLNRLGNALGTEFGSDKATNLNLAKQAFSAEVGKAFAGASVAEGDRTEIQKSISTASSFQQLAGAAKTADALLAGAQKVLKAKYDAGTQGKVNFGGDQPTTGSHVIQVGGKNYRYKGTGATDDMKSYTEVKQ